MSDTTTTDSTLTGHKDMALVREGIEGTEEALEAFRQLRTAQGSFVSGCGQAGITVPDTMTVGSLANLRSQVNESGKPGLVELMTDYFGRSEAFQRRDDWDWCTEVAIVRVPVADLEGDFEQAADGQPAV